MTTDTTRSGPLWRSDAGRFACRAHMPAPGNAAWWAHTWRRMSPEEREGLERHRGEPAVCEACAALAEFAQLDREQAS